MALKAQEISSIIQKEIESFGQPVRTVNVGTVVEIGDGIARVHGLCERYVLRAGRVRRMTTKETRHSHGHGPQSRRRGRRRRSPRPLYRIEEGDTVRTTGRIVEVPVGDALLGRVVNALGQPIDGKGDLPAGTKTPPGRAHRSRRRLPPERGHACADRYQSH